MPRSVLSLLPHVSATTSPVVSGVQLYQADAPPVTPAGFGSPGCWLNPLLSPSIVIGSFGLSFPAAAKLSPAGGELGVACAEATAAHRRSPTITASAPAPAFLIIGPSSLRSCG